MKTEKNTLKIDQALLKKLFEYDANTGSLIWRKRDCNRFNAIYAGKQAGTLDAGRMRISIDKKRYYQSRLVWIYHNGPLKKNEIIDHRNFIKLDDRISNLRKCSHSQNSCNRKSSGVTGLKGVTMLGRKFMSRITKSGKVRYLGLYSSALDAARAYNKAATTLHKEFAHLNNI